MNEHMNECQVEQKLLINSLNTLIHLFDSFAYFAHSNKCTFRLQSSEQWVEEPPQRIPYIAKYVYDVSTKEDSTQVVFITLTALFVIIVICCLLEVYRSHLAYKKRKEHETDVNIILSKEQATKMHESPGVVGGGASTFLYKPVGFIFNNTNL